MTVGLGTGSTVAFLLPALARRGLSRIRCVATSVATEQQARELGVPIEEFDSLRQLDIAIDGTDEVAPDGWLIKGGGGAHLREKIVAAAAARFVVIGDSSKPVDALGGPVPLELLRLRRRLDPGAARPRGRAARRPAQSRRRRDRRLPRSDRRPGRARRPARGRPRRRRPRPLPPGADRRRADRRRGERRAPHDRRLKPGRRCERVAGVSDLSGLEIDGRVATPSDPDWDEARLAWNLAADQQPSCGRVRRERRRRRRGRPVRRRARPQGRRPGDRPRRVPLGPLEDTILIKTERMRGIEIDPEAADARVEAGVLAMELAEAAQGHGLCSLPGSSPDVGVTGYTLGGGLSWLGRRYGFACNRVEAIELVTADGEQRRRRRRRPGPVLGAARRGRRLRDRHRPAPGAAADRRGLRRRPDLPGRARRRGGPRLPRLGGDRPRGGHLGRPLPAAAAGPRRARAAARRAAAHDRRRLRRRPRAGREPDRAAARDRRADHGQLRPDAGRRPLPDPHGPRARRSPALGTHAPIRELPDEAIDAFVDQRPRTRGRLAAAAGRAAASSAARSGAAARVRARSSSSTSDFVMSAIGSLMAPGSERGVPRDLDRIAAAMEPWTAAGGYFNFAERPCDIDAILPAETVRPPGRGQAPLGPRRPHRRQPRRRALSQAGLAARIAARRL